MRSIKNNYVFVLVAVCVLLTAFVGAFPDCIGENPFISERVLQTPTQSIFSDKFNYFVTDASQNITVTDKDNRFLYNIKGNNAKTTFDSIDSIDAAGDTVYVIEKEMGQTVDLAERMRVLRFTDSGRHREVLYDIDTMTSDGEQVIYLDGLRIIDGTAYFNELDPDGIRIYKCAEDGCHKVQFIPLEDASDIVYVSSISDDLVAVAAMMNGDIYTYPNGDPKKIYDAGKNATDDYFSIICNITCTKDTIYCCDIGLRRVFALDISGGEPEIVVQPGEYNISEPTEFGENALYTWMNASGGVVSVMASEYSIEDEDYTYIVAAKTEDGKTIYCGTTIGTAPTRRALNLAVWAALIVLAAIAIYAIIQVVIMMFKARSAVGGAQLFIFVTAVLITVLVTSYISRMYNERLINENARTLTNIAELVDREIDKDLLKKIDSPDAYFSDELDTVDGIIRGIVKSNDNNDTNIYTTLYTVHNDIISEIYTIEHEHGIMYPQAGIYSGSYEESLAESGESDMFVAEELAEGSYTYTFKPMYDDSGKLVAFAEVGTNFDRFVNENNAMYKRIVLTAAMAVIIAMLMLAELMNTATAAVLRHHARTSRLQIPAEVIRPVAFMIFFTANITTAFLPVYGMSLWTDRVPIPKEIAAALPLSAELVVSAISALVSGSLIKRTGIRSMCAAGAVAYVVGNLLSAFAPNLWVLICANSICGIGGGMLIISVNTWIATLSSEEKQNKGFMHYNAAYLAGMNCGTVIGSMIRDMYGIKAAYFMAAISAVVIILFALWLLGRGGTVKTEKKESGSMRSLLTPRVVRYFALLIIPYLVCASFLSYYFPVVADRNALSAAELSTAFLLSGVILIYMGPALGEPVVAKLGTRKAMLLASFIYAAALVYPIIEPGVVSCYVVIALFAVADCFGLAAQSVYFISLPEVKAVGESRALAVNSTIESIVTAAGSVIFGAALMLGERLGIAVICIVFSILLLLYFVFERMASKRGGNDR
ncbi:MAG: MFS transporter [Clostridia bacterium]|nr:MFS transporter [Clostridia bacterium]